MKSLRVLGLTNCGLRRVPAFVRELSSLEEISLKKTSTYSSTPGSTIGSIDTLACAWWR
jgi:hypothetical protein